MTLLAAPIPQQQNRLFFQLDPHTALHHEPPEEPVQEGAQAAPGTSHAGIYDSSASSASSNTSTCSDTRCSLAQCVGQPHAARAGRRVQSQGQRLYDSPHASMDA